MMDFRRLFETAWQMTLRFIGPSILLTLVYAIVIAVSFGVLAPVTTAGYMQSLLLALRENRSPRVGDLFSEMRLFFPLLLYFLLAGAVIAVGFLLVVLPGIVAAAFVAFATLYLMPLMTDKRMGLMDALKRSWAMAVEEPVTNQLAITVVYMAVISLGGSVVLGFLVTQPFAVFFVLAAYEERLKSESPADEPPPPPFSE